MNYQNLVSVLIIHDIMNQWYHAQPHPIIVFYLCAYLSPSYWSHSFFTGGHPSLQNTVQATINIVDVNDNSPIITPNSYVASVRENLPSGQSVLRVGTLRPQAYESVMARFLCKRSSCLFSSFQMKNSCPFFNHELFVSDHRIQPSLISAVWLKRQIRKR